MTFQATSLDMIVNMKYLQHSFIGGNVAWAKFPWKLGRPLKVLLKCMLKGLLKAGFLETSLAHFEREDSIAGAEHVACSIESWKQI